MSARDRLLAGGLLAITVGWSLALAALGSTEAILYMAPAMLVSLPLALGRFVGEEILALLRTPRAPRPRPQRKSRPVVAVARRPAAFGGRLIATFLAKRPPPAALSPIS
jgi:hypothetical protein